MKNINSHRKVANSTYAVLVRSEQEERSAFEGVVYLLFILSAVFSIWQAARQPMTVSVDTATHRAAIAQTVSGQHQGV